MTTTSFGILLDYIEYIGPLGSNQSKSLGTAVIGIDPKVLCMWWLWSFQNINNSKFPELSVCPPLPNQTEKFSIQHTKTQTQKLVTKHIWELKLNKLKMEAKSDEMGDKMTSKILSNKKCMPDSDSELELQNCDELPVTQDNQDGQHQHKD